MKTSELSRFHSLFHEWYLTHGRHELPWRQTDDPYAIYISEVMLQQTQVKTVLERYYFQFLEKFPTLQALADAPQEAVLSQWQGLGYYNRAINLHKAAKACAPQLPSNYESLIALSGIGRNTAHAILAFAYQQPVAILEANVKRIIHRIFALESATDNRLWEAATTLLDTKRPFDYNQAMMDLGAMICTPKNPNCTDCPAARICKGKTSPLAFPASKAKKTTPTRKKNILVLQDANTRLFMQPRNTRFLNGLFGFLETEQRNTHASFSGHKIHFKQCDYLGQINQTYSHFKLDADVYLHTLNAAYNSPEWYEFDDAAALPMSKADEKIIALLNKRSP